MAKQRSMSISTYNWQKLKEIEGSTMGDKIKTLFAIVEPFMPEVLYTEKNKGVKVEQSTIDMIDSYRITLGESRDNIITRAFLILDEINNTSQEECWIPFRITNPYNNSLVIEGQIEYNSKELSFNYRGNVFRKKLPPTYIVNGNDLTKELYLWHDNLEWVEIINIIITHARVQHSVKSKDYILDVN